jgi:hypothetical protein
MSKVFLGARMGLKCVFFILIGGEGYVTYLQSEKNILKKVVK